MLITGKNFTILSLILSIVFIIIGSLLIKNYKENKSFKEIIKTATKETKLIDANFDHNQALDFSDYIKSQNLKLPKIIINFDTHSDLYINKPITIPKEEGIASWLNAYLAKYPEVEELYWVMPDKEAITQELQVIFAQNDINELSDGVEFYGNSLYFELPQDYFIKNPLNKISYSQDFIIDKRNGRLNEYIEKNKYSQQLTNQYTNFGKRIKITTCTIDTLPDFKGSKVFLSIDADYISNSGFDTLKNFKLIRNKKEIMQEFFEIFETINSKNIQPEYISLSLSPQYLPKQYHKFTYKIFQKIIKFSNKKDALNTYTRGYNITPSGRNPEEKIDYTK